MRATWTHRIFASTIVFGILLSSTASGSHLDSSTLPSGPPPFHLPQQAQKPALPQRGAPAPGQQGIANQAAPAPTNPSPPSTIAKQKAQMPKPQTNAGWRLLLNGQPQAAMGVYRQALKDNPQSAIAYLGLGISLKSLGEMELAQKALTKAVDLDPRLPSALVHLGYLYAEGHLGQSDLSTARRLFNEASELGDPFASIALLDMKTRSKL